MDRIILFLEKVPQATVGTIMIWPVNEYMLTKIFSTAWKFIVG